VVPGCVRIEPMIRRRPDTVELSDGWTVITGTVHRVRRAHHGVLRCGSGHHGQDGGRERLGDLLTARAAEGQEGAAAISYGWASS